MNNVPHSLFQSTRYQCGLTLVEILVALVISAFLMAGVIQLFLGSKQTYRSHDALSRIQENGRFALETMSRDIRAAGYYPTTTTTITTTTATVPPTTTTTTKVTPPPTWPSGSPTFITNNNSDLTLRWFDGEVGSLDAGPPCPGPSFICSRRYFIGPRTVGSAVPACALAATSLLLSRDGGAPQEVIEGVEAMRVFRAGNSVQVNLLLVSLEDNVVTQPQTVVFPSDTNTVWPVNDRCLRQIFSTTVAIRNP
jgi:type IV pilus assembly protein PilW